MPEPLHSEELDPAAVPLARQIEAAAREQCTALHLAAQQESERIEAEAARETEEMLAAGRVEFASLEKEIRDAIVGRAKWVAEAVTARQVGEAVERTIALCDQRLQQFAATDDFAPSLEALVLEAAQGARGLKPAANGEPLGELLVGPQDVEPCREIVKRRQLDLTVCEDPSISGGVELTVTGTTFRIRNTLASRRERMSARFEEIAATKLRQALAEEAPQ